MRASLYVSACIGSLVLVYAAQVLASSIPPVVAPAAEPQQKLAPSATTFVQPQTQVATSAPITKAPSVEEPVIAAPVELSIPSIKLAAPIVPVGLNSIGQMDVPNGSTNDIGWYKDGTVPGTEGSAVLDAHVFAALKDLRYAKVGDSIYIKTQSGQTLRFIIRSSMLYKLADTPADLLFNRTGGDYLNIITCAGTFVPSQGTYDHRLVVYAELANQ